MAIANTSDLAYPSLTFLYHELRRDKSVYSYALEVKQFEQQVELFARMRQRKGEMLRPEISFDDGHQSVYEHAFPILTRAEIPAHVFVTVGWIGQKAGYMSWEEVRALHRAGNRVGAHGWTHSLLTCCTPVTLKRELADARRTLEDKLGTRITSMSLPGGRYNRRVLEQCHESGYTEVFSSIPRAEAGLDRPIIGRVNVHSDLSLPTIQNLLEPKSPELGRLARRYHLKEAAKTLLGDDLYARFWAMSNRHEPDGRADWMAAP